MTHKQIRQVDVDVDEVEDVEGDGTIHVSVEVGEVSPDESLEELIDPSSKSETTTEREHESLNLRTWMTLSSRSKAAICGEGVKLL
tara:strand:+ start:407 stop:664 length:258 start_codon:yes stop_codon:yes gene_type:complete